MEECREIRIGIRAAKKPPSQATSDRGVACKGRPSAFQHLTRGGRLGLQDVADAQLGIDDRDRNQLEAGFGDRVYLYVIGLVGDVTAISLCHWVSWLLWSSRIRPNTWDFRRAVFLGAAESTGRIDRCWTRFRRHLIRHRLRRWLDSSGCRHPHLIPGLDKVVIVERTWAGQVACLACPVEPACAVRGGKASHAIEGCTVCMNMNSI